MVSMFKRIFPFAFLLLSSFVSAQVAPRRCNTDERTTQLLVQHPEWRSLWEKSIAEDEMHRSMQPSQRTSGVTPRVIPVVVHVIQSTIVPKMPDAVVISQIDVLNEDYSRTNADTINTPADFLPVAADANVQFCLATIDPNGCPTTGINRLVNPALAQHNSDTDEDALKAFVQWDPHKYLNVWVPEKITTSVLGYATLPNWLAFDPDHDGVVVSAQYFGRGPGVPATEYNLGRTLTHEVGHWLGLYHTFQNGCAGMNAANCATAGDRCCDTPPTASDNYGCPAVQNTCAESPVNMVDQTCNYMDYVDDRCMNMFSQDQADWFYYYLDGARSVIWSPGNLAATGCDGSSSSICAPQAEFSSNLHYICTGQSVQFTDLSQGPPDTWAWDFPGGTPSTSTDQHPTVTYNTPGTYSVTLVATNSLGSSSATSTMYIVVVDPSLPPLAEGFELSASIPSGWETIDADEAGTWIVNTVASSAGAASAAIDNYTINAGGTEDALITPPYNLSTSISGQLSFDYAYKRFSPFRYDSLSVWISTDCGSTWTNVWAKSGATLATVSGYLQTSAYVPADSTDWRTETIDLTPYSGTSSLKARFRSDGNNGQWLYLDQINLTTIVSRDEAAVSLPQVSLSPNPFSEQLDVIVNLPAAGEVNIEVRDLTGRCVWTQPSLHLNAGRNLVQPDRARMQGLCAGVYLLNVSTAQGSSTVKVVKQ